MISILFIVAYVLIAICIISSAYIVFGENYVYNMTQEEKDEFLLSQLCLVGVEMNVSSLPECNMIVGSIDTNYGEALK